MAAGGVSAPAPGPYRHSWLGPADVAAVAEVVRLVAEVSRDQPFVGLPGRPSQRDRDRLAEELTHGLASARLSLLTVEHASDGVVACVALRRPATANQRHRAELSTGAVHRAHRGFGLVAAVFTEIVRHCEASGIETLLLDVRAGIRAEQVWRGYGFEEYGRLADYGRSDGHSYAGVFLAQSVDRLRARVMTR